MKKGAIWLLVSCLALASMVLASCGAGTSKTTPATSAKPPVTTTAPPVSKPSVAVATTPATPTPTKEMAKDSLGRTVEKPKYGGTFTWILYRDTLGFDSCYGKPHSCYSVLLTNDRLFTGDWAKGLAGTGQASYRIQSIPSPDFMRPQLATKWEIPDKETIIYRIRQGIHFQNKAPTNGRELTADDIVFSIKRVFDLPSNAVGVQHLGIGPKSIKATDNYTVEIKCPPDNLGPLFQDISLRIDIYPKDMAVSGAKDANIGDMRDWKKACGTGPFTLEEYISKNSITMKKKPDSWDVDPLFPQNKVPYVDTVKYLVVEDGSTRLAAMRTGKADAIGFESLSPADAANLQKTAPKLKSAEWAGAQPYLVFMRMDTKPYNDIRVRKALHLAINFQEIVKSYYGGKAGILSWPVPDIPEFKGLYMPLNELPASVQELFSYSPDKAKKLLADAGYPNGFETSIVCGEADVQDLSLLASFWEAIGVKCKIDVRESGVLNTLQENHQFPQMTYRYNSTGTPFIFMLTRKGPTANMSLVDDPIIEKAYLDCATNFFDEPKKFEFLKKTIPYQLEQVWMIQFPQAFGFGFWQPWVKNYNGELGVGFHCNYNFSRYIWIDPAEKAAAGF